MSYNKASKQYRLNRQNALKLFLVCNFPIHIWSILIFLQHVSWLINYGYGVTIGTLAYFLFITMIESTGVFLFVLISAYVFRLDFSATQIVSFLSLFAWNISIGMMMAQFLNLRILDQRILWFLVVIFITFLTFIAYRLLNIQTFANLAEKMFERVLLLSSLFFGLDLIAIMIILGRNLFY